MKIESTIHHEYNINDNIFRNPEINFYKAIDEKYQRFVGIKEIDLSDCNPKQAKLKINNAKREIISLLYVSDMSTTVPCVLDDFYDEGSKKYFIVMQWINGEELTNKLSKVNSFTFLNWMIELCSILSIMGNKNLYHKDIKPANIMIDKANRLRLIDFNLSISNPNLVSGTLNYRAPEMKENISNDFSRCDMFSIGVIMYQYYTGKIPIEGVDYARSTSRLIKKNNKTKWSRFEQPIKRNKNIPQEINDIIVKCMSYNPVDRYESYQQLKNTLIKAKKNDHNGG